MSFKCFKENIFQTFYLRSQDNFFHLGASFITSSVRNIASDGFPEHYRHSEASSTPTTSLSEIIVMGLFNVAIINRV